MGNIRLSLCMIVKNEEDSIEQCLKSVVDTVDEMIIVDTGSTDRTIDICRHFGAKIENFKWNGSFADARNYSIEKATGDWILWMDADEELDETDRAKIREGNHFADYDLITLHLVNYYGEEVDQHKSTDMAHPRLFRNNGLRFKNKMHESLDYSHISKERIGYLEVKIHHYGYMDPIMKKKGKTGRNLKMLMQQIKDRENEYWAHYYIALEYYNHKEYTKAMEHTNASILSFLQNGVLPPSMVYKLKYSILISTGCFDGALQGIDRVLLLYPDYVDVHFFKGVILFHLGQYEESVKSFDTCLELGEENLNYLILKGTGSFQALYYKGLCQQKLDQKEDAVTSLVRALKVEPEYKEARDELDRILKTE